MQAQFSVEETRLIKKLILAGTNDNPLKNSLLKKLSLNSEIDSMPRLFVKARLGKFVDQLAESIKNKTQVVLKNYHSANSNEIRDRLVEPIHFGDNYQSVVALDTQDKICKQFKLDRIGEVIEMKNKFEFEELHQKNQTDIFGMTGDSDTWVTLTLKSSILSSVAGRISHCLFPILKKQRTDINFTDRSPTLKASPGSFLVCWMK